MGIFGEIPENFIPEGYNPIAQVSHPVQPIMVSAPPIVHSVPVINDKIYHAHVAPSEILGIHDRMDDF